MGYRASGSDWLDTVPTLVHPSEPEQDNHPNRYADERPDDQRYPCWELR